MDDDEEPPPDPPPAPPPAADAAMEDAGDDDEDADAARGSDPPMPDDPSAPRIVGRASVVDFADASRQVHYFLVKTPGRRRPKQKQSYDWFKEEQLTTAPLRAAYDLLPPERRAVDPLGNGWVTAVVGAQGPATSAERKTTAERVPIVSDHT